MTRCSQSEYPYTLSAANIVRYGEFITAGSSSRYLSIHLLHEGLAFDQIEGNRHN